MEFDSFKRINNGDLIQGVVIDIRDNEIELDLNSYVSGIILKEDFSFDDAPLYKQVKKGDTILAKVKKVVNNDEQIAYLTCIPLIKKNNLEKIKAIYDNNETFSPKIKREVKGGYIYEYLGYELFMPVSQYVEGFDAKIIEFDQEKNKIVISNKVIKKAIDEDNKSKEYDLINVGDVINAEIIEIMPYGILVKAKHNTALVRISQLTYDFIKNPSDVVKKGEKIDVKVIKKENGKIEASRKALLKSPFELYKDAHKVGDTVKGVVKQKLPFGIIITLDKNVDGLLHESEYAWNPKSNFKDYIKLDDELELMIISIDGKNEKISLSKKAIEDNPWKRVTAKKGDTVECKVEGINPGKGVNVSTCGIDAFVSINELSNDKITKIEDFLNVGDTFKALVVDIDASKWYINLSAKKYQEMLEKQEFEKYMSNSNEEDHVTLKDLFQDILK